MNKSYIYKDGKAIIQDENDLCTLSEYCDNLDEILVQENIIEEIENKIEKLTNELLECPKVYKKYKPVPLYIALGFTLVIPPVLLWAFTGSNPFTVVTDTARFGSVNLLLLENILVTPWFLAIASAITLGDYYIHKNSYKEGKGISNELEYLKQRLAKEKETLISLQKEKTINQDDEEPIYEYPIFVRKINDKEELKSLRKQLKLYYDLGFNEKKYYRYYRKGKLDKKLQKRYDEAGIEIAKQYLEKKGPSLVKKR